MKALINFQVTNQGVDCTSSIMINSNQSGWYNKGIILHPQSVDGTIPNITPDRVTHIYGKAYILLTDEEYNNFINFKNCSNKKPHDTITKAISLQSRIRHVLRDK